MFKCCLSFFQIVKVSGWGGGPCDFSVSPSPFGLDFGTLNSGTSDSGLTINNQKFYIHGTRIELMRESLALPLYYVRI